MRRCLLIVAGLLLVVVAGKALVRLFPVRLDRDNKPDLLARVELAMATVRTHSRCRRCGHAQVEQRATGISHVFRCRWCGHAWVVPLPVDPPIAAAG